jgi:hypothetical protein
MAGDDQDESVVGTWIGAATFDTPRDTPPLVEAELASIHRGGIVTGTSGIDHSSQNPFVPPGLVVELSDYFGSWAPVGDSNQIAVTFKRLLFAGSNTPSAIYHQLFPGQNVGMASIQSVVTLQHTNSGDILRGPFTFQLTTLDGQPVPADMGGTGSGTVSLSRVTIEPLATPADDPVLNGIGSDPTAKQCFPNGTHCTKGGYNPNCCSGLCGSWTGKKPYVCF